MSPTPAVIVAAAGTGYAAAFLGLRQPPWTSDARTSLKAISSFHALSTSVAVLYSLSQPWPIGSDRGQLSSSLAQPHFLDDRENPMIRGHSELGNAITAWETGYLLYDTVALLTITRKDPVMLIHHGMLLGALGYLQIYITRQQERGIWIILAFLFMNASNPLLHLRWWRRKRTGKDDGRIDTLFAVAFAVCRFGTISYVLKKYGTFHRLSAWEAFLRQRAVCKVGTASLFLLNAAWWLRLVASISRSIRAKRPVLPARPTSWFAKTPPQVQ